VLFELSAGCVTAGCHKGGFNSRTGWG
jgi:hypothetical protein